MRNQQQSYQLTVAQEQPSNQMFSNQPRVRHVYLQQENIYGRFVPYLLLRDQLQSQIDSSGNTALHHMCSHNSPYIPLFLSSIKSNDPILNKKSKLGHTPLDVAGLYCCKQYIQMIKQKGGIDNGNVDYWAVQGGNLANWSGKIYPENKTLIHWAAYNDMPQVIAEYAHQGINISQLDSNGYTPIDLAVLNKSYSSMRVLAQYGQRPKKQLLDSSDSQSIIQYFKNLEQKPSKKTLKSILKISTVILFIVLCYILSRSQLSIIMEIATVVIMIFILLRTPQHNKYMNNERTTIFTSELFMNKTISSANIIQYLVFHVFVVASGVLAIYQLKITNHLIAFASLIVLVFSLSYFIHLCVQVYGICKNLTYSQLFYSYKWMHLWQNVKYIEDRMFAIRTFNNTQDQGTCLNIKNYLSK